MKIKLRIFFILFICITFPGCYHNQDGKIINLLNQQLKAQLEQNKKQDMIIQQQQESMQLTLLQLQIEKSKLKSQQEEENLQLLLAQEEAAKTWYEKAWQKFSPTLQRAILGFIIDKTINKMLNAGIDGLDYVTGDIPANNGYTTLAIYAGTFIAADSLQTYMKKRENKTISANSAVLYFDKKTEEFKQLNGKYIHITETIANRIDLDEKAQFGKKLAEEYERTKSNNNNSSTNNSYQTGKRLTQ